MSEIGFARARGGWGSADEDNWDLRFPQSVRVFAKMAREDSQVTSVLKAVSLPIQRAGWQLDSNGCDPEIVAVVAEDLRLRVLGDDPNAPLASRSGRVSWSEHLQQALLALTFGHMFFEQVYVERGGRSRLHKLAPRFPSTVKRIEVDHDGGLAGIVQGGRSGEVFIPVDHLVAYVHDARDASWTGTSVLRPAYKHWVLRDEFLRLESQVLSRNGMGVPVYTGSELTDNAESDLRYGQEVAEQLRAGDAAAASIPAGAKLDLVGVKGQLVSPREAIAYHDSMIARGVLAHFLNLEGKGGSYALAETQSDLFIQSLQTVAEWIAETATQHVVEDMVHMAFPDYDGLCPRIVFDPIASKKELSAQDLAALKNSGLVVADKPIKEDVRRRFSLPPMESWEETKKRNPEAGKKSADELAKLVEVATSLSDQGVEFGVALEAVGLNPAVADGLDTSPAVEVAPIDYRDSPVSSVKRLWLQRHFKEGS